MSAQVILACSARKRVELGRAQAIALYDGPAWRTLRANLTCGIDPPLALSAEYGLISAYYEIEPYDRRMDAARARELIDPTFERLLDRLAPGRIFFFGGRHYRDCFRQAVQLAEIELELDIPVTYSSGGIGQQLGQLAAFLRRNAQ